MVLKLEYLQIALPQQIMRKHSVATNEIEKELLATGVRIFEFRPDAAERRRIMTSALQEEIDFTPVFGLHAKSMVIDGYTTVIGTFNLDPRSANLNTECVTIIHSKQGGK